MNGLNILLYSLKLNNNNIIKLILEYNNHNYDINDNNLYTPFHYLAKYSNINTCKLFKFNNDFINKQNMYGETCLHIAINYNNDDCTYNKEVVIISLINYVIFFYEFLKF